jgi:hypothetical protein
VAPTRRGSIRGVKYADDETQPASRWRDSDRRIYGADESDAWCTGKAMGIEEDADRGGLICVWRMGDRNDPLPSCDTSGLRADGLE